MTQKKSSTKKYVAEIQKVQFIKDHSTFFLFSSRFRRNREVQHFNFKTSGSNDAVQYSVAFCLQQVLLEGMKLCHMRELD